MLALDLRILDLDVKHFAEVLTKTVRGGSLNTSAIRRDVSLNSCGVIATGEFFILRLAATDDGDGEKLLIHTGIKLKDFKDLFPGKLFSKVGGMAFLPKELSRTEERSGLLGLPANNIVPLV